MAYWLQHNLIDGSSAAGLSDMAGPWIVIHVSALDMADELLVGEIRALEDVAWRAEALNIADYVVNSAHHCGARQPIVPEGYEDYEELLRRYAGTDDLIDRALAVYEAAAQRAHYKALKAAKRREVQSRYDRLFVAIGRRDGFQCRHCGTASNDLQIDHVIALAHGGTNDLTNLQLLCRACNLTKGATE